MREMVVATIQQIMQKTRVSRNTAFIALRKWGHYSSFNCGGQYQTLKGTPRFGTDGLWFHAERGFSRHGTLPQTIKVLIEMSTEGMTIRELEVRLKTRVHNQLSHLLREGQIGQFKLGRQSVYVCAQEERRIQQQGQRMEGVPQPMQAPVSWGRGEPFLPEGLDAMLVVRLLVQMIEKPQASVASLSKTLQSQGFEIDAEDIRKMLDFYGVKKTTR